MLLTIIAISVIGVGLAILLLLWWMRRKIGIPVGNMIYSDSQREPGQVLKSKTIPLVGKPDFLKKEGKYIIPIELKRGKTPSSPYPSHIAQLYAYCLLVEENYGIRPPYGVIDYPEQDFKLEFNEDDEKHLRMKINEIINLKNGQILRSQFTHICRSCREQHIHI